jgi:uncharacterized protein
MMRLESDTLEFDTSGNRSPATCHWKCADACAQPVPNQSDNEYSQSVIQRSLDRRSVLKGGLASLMTIAGASRFAPALAQDTMSFKPIQLSNKDQVILAEGYAHNIVIRWGDPVLRGGKPFDISNFDAKAQEASFGYNNDYCSFLPLPNFASGNSSRALLWSNHEYTNPEMMFKGYTRGKATKDQVDVEMAAHGGSIVEVARNAKGEIENIAVSDFNRRITALTPMELTGPAGGHPLLQTKDDPSGRRVMGMLNNCGGGTTPWGTVLTGEENFNGYFSYTANVKNEQVKMLHSRYGMSAQASGRTWEMYYGRFNLEATPNEPFRFGYIVEIDPYDPTSTPKKRTALGRFKHEGAETAVAPSGQVVMYMGDDERFEYMYKFVTKGRFNPNDRAANRDLLDEGTLYVAKLNEDGTGAWLPLVVGNGKITAENGFATQADVCIKTRLAADLLGATKMDRPEDFERNPVTGAVYCVLTNNSRRTAAQIDKANPRAENKDGHILELLEEGNDPTSTQFKYGLFLVCGNPNDSSTYFAGFAKDKVSPIATPDNISFDRLGNMWIATDGLDASSLTRNDGVFMVPTQGPKRGEVKQFMSSPIGAEVCGPIFTPDNKNFFASIQHPGEGGTFEDPFSSFPDGKGKAVRPSVIAVRKLDGGVIGS